MQDLLSEAPRARYELPRGGTTTAPLENSKSHADSGNASNSLILKCSAHRLASLRGKILSYISKFRKTFSLARLPAHCRLILP